jgi:hypothetical protein
MATAQGFVETKVSVGAVAIRNRTCSHIWGRLGVRRTWRAGFLLACTRWRSATVAISLAVIVPGTRDPAPTRAPEANLAARAAIRTSHPICVVVKSFLTWLLCSLARCRPTVMPVAAYCTTRRVGLVDLWPVATRLAWVQSPSIAPVTKWL